MRLIQASRVQKPLFSIQLYGVDPKRCREAVTISWPKIVPTTST
jgi:hypothetical protein